MSTSMTGPAHHTCRALNAHPRASHTSERSTEGRAFSLMLPRCAACRIMFSTPRALSGFTRAIRATAAHTQDTLKQLG